VLDCMAHGSEGVLPGSDFSWGGGVSVLGEKGGFKFLGYLVCDRVVDELLGGA